MKMTRMFVVPDRGQNLYMIIIQFTVLKSKMPWLELLRYLLLSRKNMIDYFSCCLKLVPLRGKNVFEPRLSNEIDEIFDPLPPPPPPPPGCILE